MTQPYPVQVHGAPVEEPRNRLTVGFRMFLAIPHLLLVGSPIAAMLTWHRSHTPGHDYGWSTGGGVLGIVACVAALIAWFSIVFTGRHPDGLWNLAEMYVRWRVRATAYVALLRDEYPPFGEGPYPVQAAITRPHGERNRLTVAFRLVLAIPHLIVLWMLGIAWGIVTVLAWFAILLTGEYPLGLYRFSVSALRWTTRVEAYLLLLVDDYPPFRLDP